MPRGARPDYKDWQLMLVRAWTRRSARKKAASPLRYSKRRLARVTGIPESSLRGLLAARSDPRAGYKLRVSDAEIISRYESERSNRAKHNMHELVTAEFVAEELQAIKGGTKFRTKARIQKASANKPEVRTPSACPIHGDKARRSALARDLKNHHRV